VVGEVVGEEEDEDAKEDVGRCSRRWSGEVVGEDEKEDAGWCSRRWSG
jgi:hypothetical protein